jgi:hypothetical protein
MLKSTEFRRDIVAGIISSLIFLILFQPIINFLGVLVQSISNGLLSGLSNSIYSNAALGQRNYIDVIFFSLIISIYFGTATGWLSANILKKKIETSEKTNLLKKFRKSLMSIIIILFIIISVYLLRLGILMVSDLQLNTSFEQRTTVLAPLLTDQQEEELRSSWASMKNRDDYEKINKTMDTYAQQYNIELPKRLWK